MSMDPGAYILCILIALTFAVFTVIAFAIEETGAERIGAYFDRQFGEVRSGKTSVPGPRGSAGDPARHGGMLPCPVAATPDAANSTHIEPRRAGGFYVNTEVHRLAAVAQSVADEIEEQRRASRTVIPFWQAASVSRITAGQDMRRADESRWPHLTRTWTDATATGSFAAICVGA